MSRGPSRYRTVRWDSMGIPGRIACSWICGSLILVSFWGCGSDNTGPFAGDPFVVSWRSDEPGRASFIYGESSGLPDRVAYETAAHPESTHVLRLLGVEEGRSYRGRWRLHKDDGAVQEEPPEVFRVDGMEPLPPLFSFTMIDVGWGDAHLIRTRDGSHVLVDAGRPDHAPDVVRYLSDRGVDDDTPLTGIVLSHPDCDHVGGFVGTLADSADGVLESFRVQWALESAGSAGSDAFYGRYRELLEQQGAIVYEAPDGATSETEPMLRWGGDLSVDVLNSGNNVGDQLPNNASLVLKLRIGGISLLTGGDALIPVERRLLEIYGDALRSHVLKVHHHGNSDGTLGEFLEAVRPMAALVPIASEEVLDIMPSGAVLQRLRDVGADVFRSDQIEELGLEGGFHVTVWTDGSAVEVSWEASRTPHEPGDFYCDPTLLGEGLDPSAGGSTQGGKP